MHDILQNIKKLFLEPQIYAVVLESKGGIVLHLGVHYSLDEAVRAATPAVNMVTPSGEVPRINLWSSIQGRDLIRSIVSMESAPVIAQAATTNPIPEKPKEPISLESQAESFKKAKNELMQKLISTDDLTLPSRFKDFLSESELKLVISEIIKKQKDGNASQAKAG